MEEVTRKTRFVCVSDTHNSVPGGAWRLPPGDVLIHAGDMSNQGTYAELEKSVKWIEEADFECKIVIAGNHDITLDTDFYAQYGLQFHNQNPQDSELCQKLLSQAASITWLRHEAKVIKLASQDGPRTMFKIFGSPLSPRNGTWAFGYDAEEAPYIWDKIPLDCDIVLTHTPPKYHLDERNDRRAVGCETLRETLWRVRPKLAMCGHVHESRGVDRVIWDLNSTNVKFRESSTQRWIDSGLDNKKLSLVDLTAKGRQAIANDGQEQSRREEASTVSPLHTDGQSESRYDIEAEAAQIGSSLLAVPPGKSYPTNYGFGGDPPRCDVEALSGRLSRLETVIVNASMMASSWPHGPGGKKFNNPIVVDIDLPVWEEVGP